MPLGSTPLVPAQSAVTPSAPTSTRTFRSMGDAKPSIRIAPAPVPRGRAAIRSTVAARERSMT